MNPLRAFRFLNHRTSGSAGRRRRGKQPRPEWARLRLILENLEDRLAPAMVNWTGAGGDSFWSNPRNWDTGAVPGAADDAVIGSSFSSVTITSANDSAVHSVRSAASLQITGGTYAVAADSLLSSGLSLASGALAGAGNLTVNGLLTWTSGTMKGPGQTTARGGLVIGDSSFKYLDGRTLSNAGTATWATGNFPLALSNGAAFQNLAGGVLDLQADVSVQNNGGAASSVSNAGTLKKSAGTGTARFDIPLSNSGTVQVQSGTLALSAGGSATGSFSLAAGTLSLTNGSFTFHSGASATGSGVLAVTGGSALVEAGASLTVPNLAISGGTLMTTGNLSVGSALSETGGTLTGSGTVTVNGLLTWTAGTMSGSGQTAARGGLVIGDGSFKYLDGRTLSNAGTATWATGNFPLALSNGASFQNLAGATLDLQADISLQNNGGAAPSFNNAGTLKKSAGTGTARFDVPLTNSGTVQVLRGSFSPAGGGRSTGAFQISAEAALAVSTGYTLQSGASSSGAGSIQVNGTLTVAAAVQVQNLGLSGTLTGPGPLTINGTVTWVNGSMTGPGTTSIAAGAALVIGDSSFKYLDGRTLTNAGTATWATGNFPLALSNGAAFQNLAGGVLDLQADVSVQNNGGAASSVSNAGTLKKSAGTGTARFDIPLSNSGTVQVQSGTLALSAGGSATGSFSLAAGTLSLTNGSFTFHSGASATGNGTLVVAGASALVEAGTTVSIANLAVSGGTLTATGNLSVGSSFTESGGTLTGSGTVSVNGLLTWTAGTMSGSGQTAARGGLVIGDGYFKYLDGRTLSNAATATWPSNNFPLALSNGATFQNLAGAILDLQADISLQNNGGATSSVSNAGILKKSAGTGTARFDIPLTNSGTVQVLRGAFNPAGDGSSTGTFQISAGAALNVSNGYTLQSGATSSGDGAVQVNGTLTVAAAVQVQNLVLNGTLTGPGPLTVNGTLTWTSGHMVGPGTTSIAAGAALVIGDSYFKYLEGRTLNNAGTVTWPSNNFPLALSNGAAFNNLATGVLDLQADISVQNNGGPTSSFNNAGMLKKSAGTGTARFDIPLTNSGTVQIARGRLNLAGDGSSTGAFQIAAGAALAISNGYTLQSGATASGAGAVQVNGTLTVAGAAQVQNLVLNGTQTGAGTLTISGTLTWASGHMVGPGTTSIAAGAALVIGDGYFKYLEGRTLSNAGTATWPTNNFPLALSNGAAFQNLATGILDLQADISVQNNGGAASSFSNAGTLKKSAGTGNATINVPFTNTGIVQIFSGTLSLAGSGLSLDGSGFLASQPGATVTVTGNLLGATQNASLFSPQGTVLFNGSGTATAPQLLEAMSQDLGNTGQGFTRNFAYGTLALANNTYVKLVDYSKNSPGNGPESVYVNSLIVPRGTTLDLNLYHVYARAVQIDGTLLNGMINPVPPGGPLALGVPAPGSIATDTQADDWTFFARAGQSASVIVGTGAASSTVPLQPYLNYANVRLVDPSGATLANATNSSAGTDVSLLGVSLPLTGTYHVQIRAGQAGARGFYQIVAWNATVNSNPVNLNQVVTSQIDTPFRIDRWAFAAAAGQQIRFDLLNSGSSAIKFDLTGPGNYVGFTGLSHSSDLLTLPTSGSYLLRAYTTTGGTGAYAFRLKQTSQTDITLGTAYRGTLAGNGQAQLFRVSVSGGQPLRVVLQDGAAADHNELYVKFGAPPTRGDYQYAFSNPASANQLVLVPAAAPGNWYILVYGEAVPAPSNYTLVATASSVFLTGVTPDHAGNGADATLTLSGSGFDAATTVSLVAADHTVYPAAAVSVDLPTQITATFRAGAVPAGVYTVRVTHGSDTGELANAFQMTAGGKAVLQTNLVVPGTVGRHATATLTLEYANTGNLAMPAPLLVLTGSDKALLTLDQSQVVQGLWTSAKPDGLSDTIYILASGATPGVLQPGEKVDVPVYYSGLLQPWDFSHTTVTFNVSSLTAADSRPIDWSTLKAGLQPPGINGTAWDAVFANLVALTGNTWGAYVAMLDNNAAYLGRLGEKVTDVNQLWNFQLRQAIGFSTISQVGAVTDAQMAQPGLPLTFGRYFTPSLLGRYQLGVLGWGWTWTGGWQRTLRVDADGSVTITDTDGTQRRFQPDRRGGYFAQAGDQGTLSLSGGIYALQELDGRVTHFRPDGRVDSQADPNGNRITAGYTGNLLTSLTHSAGQALQFHYNAAGRIDRVTDSANRATVFSYDPINQYLMSVQTPDGLVTRYTYDQTANPLKMHSLLTIEHPGNTHDYFGYDAYGRLSDTHHDGNAEQITYAYNLGTVAATDTGMNTTTRYFFDARGLLAKVDDPLHHDTHLTYDNAYNLVGLIDAAGQMYRYQYDVHGNLIQSSDPLGHTTSTVYGGPYNQPTQVTDALGNQTRYNYDSHGNLLSITYADGSTEQYLPDTAGNPMQWINRRGQPVQFQRDSAGRVRHVVYADGTRIDYNYDPVRGNLLSATDASGTTTLRYDDPQHPGWVTRVVYPDGRYLAYQYDPAGRRSRMTDQDGNTVQYHYDAVGRLDMLLDGSNKVIVHYAYDPSGMLQRTDNANGTYTTYNYTEIGQVKSLINYAPNGTINSRFDYTYNLLGQVATMTTLEGLWTYGYDAVGQLTSVHLPNGRTIQYKYDAGGNRTSVTDNGVTTNYTTNNLNEYVTVGNVTYGYDADGNMISKRDASGLTTFTYDEQNRLTKVVGPAGTWTYEYDVFGNCRATTVNGQRTNYLLDPYGMGDVIGAYNGAGGLVAHYTYGLGLTSRTDAAGVIDFYDFDAVGSTIGLTSATGAYVNHYSYLPFGESLSSTETVANPFDYVGRWGVQTQGNGLDFMRARFYAASLGVFTGVDPLGHPGESFYTYARNNPVQRVDPLGLQSNGLDQYFHDLCSRTIDYNQLLNDVSNGTYTAGEVNAVNADGQQVLNDAQGADSQVANMITFSRPGPTAVLKYGRFAYNVVNAANDCQNRKKGQDNPNGGAPGGASGSPGSSGSSATANSQDPNDKTGPAGFGASHFITLGQSISYRIDFENDATATAPAQRVDITDQLSVSLDWNTFAITEVGFGDFLLSVPAGSQHFQTTVSMAYNGKTFDVQIEVGLHSDIGQVFAVFQSVDPHTSLPPDVLTGFLPPENGTGRGMGHISYTIRPKANLTTGTQIRNIALVTFDLGDTIATDQVDPHNPGRGTDPTKEALVTIDAVPPPSSVQSLPAVTTTPAFLVQWSGQDDTGGSGVAYFDIYVSDNGGPFLPWLQRTALTQAMYTGQDGHTYGFYSVATDNAGNREATPTTAQATTTLHTAHHFAVTASINPATAGVAFTLTVRALDVNNNPATAYTGTVHFSSTVGMDGLPADYQFQANENGVHTFTLTLTAAGVRTITVADLATPAITGNVTVTVAAAAADHFEIDTVDSTAAGQAIDVTVIALDPYGNVDINYAGTVTFSATDAQAGLPDDYTFTADEQGVHTFTAGVTLFTAGTQTVAATDVDTGLLIGSADILVTPAPADHFQIDAVNSTVAGVAFDITVTALDPYGNIDVNYTGTITFSSTDAQAALPNDYTFTADDQGVHTFPSGVTLFTAGTQTVLVTDADTGLLTGSTDVLVTPAPADHFRIDAPANTVAGQPFDITVTALDPYGNVDVNYAGTVTFTTSDSDPGVVLPADYTFTADDAGIVTFAGGAALVTPGDQSITATDSASGISGTALVTVVPGGAPGLPRGGMSDRVQAGLWDTITPAPVPRPAPSASASPETTAKRGPMVFRYDDPLSHAPAPSHRRAPQPAGTGRVDAVDQVFSAPGENLDLPAPWVDDLLDGRRWRSPA